MKFNTAYSKKDRVVFEPTGHTRTKQSFKEECDVNNILRQYMKTGVMPGAKDSPGEYKDMTGEDFQSAMNLITSAQSMFEELPSALRKRFNNDPSKYMRFVNNDKNVAEMRDLGLLRADYQSPEELAAAASSTQPAGEASLLAEAAGSTSG